MIFDEFLQEFRDMWRQFIDIFRLLLLDYFQITKSNRQCVDRTRICRGDIRRVRTNRCTSTAKEDFASLESYSTVFAEFDFLLYSR